MLSELFAKWPLVRQILEGGDGTGPEAMSEQTRGLRMKNHGAEVARSICPYCGVGCGQLIFHKQGEADFHRRRSGLADFARAFVSQRRRPATNW